jgi:ribonuclease M5
MTRERRTSAVHPERFPVREVIVVEGAHDVSAVHQAVDAEVIATGGFCIRDHTFEAIRRARERVGVVVLTDPDPAGEQIRARIEAAVGPCQHAYLSREDALRGADVGVENAHPTAIRQALLRARATRSRSEARFTMQMLQMAGLQGGRGAGERRKRVGRALGLGEGNARQLLRRLNGFGIEPAELEAALATLEPRD